MLKNRRVCFDMQGSSSDIERYGKGSQHRRKARNKKRDRRRELQEDNSEDSAKEGVL